MELLKQYVKFLFREAFETVDIFSGIKRTAKIRFFEALGYKSLLS